MNGEPPQQAPQTEVATAAKRDYIQQKGGTLLYPKRVRDIHGFLPSVIIFDVALIIYDLLRNVIIFEFLEVLLRSHFISDTATRGGPPEPGHVKQ